MKINKRKVKKYIFLSILIIGIFTFIFFRNSDILKFALENDNLDLNSLKKIVTSSLNSSQDYNTNFTEATVKRVVDGDTLVVNINKEDYKVRIIGVNTPESTTKIETYGKEASNFTKSIMTLGKKIYLEKDVSETDKYGRLLRYVWLEVPNEIDRNNIENKMFNAILLKNGYAQVATYPPDVKYVDYFTNIQKEAKKKNIGLWGL